MYKMGCAHWRNLANTIEPSVCGGDATLLSNYSDQVFYVSFTFMLIGDLQFSNISLQLCHSSLHLRHGRNQLTENLFRASTAADVILFFVDVVRGLR